MISGIEIKPSSFTDDAFLDFVEKKMFWFFWNHASTTTGLIKWGDLNFASGNETVSSVAVDGMGLSSFTIGAQRGWITPQQARDRIMTMLNSFDT